MECPDRVVYYRLTSERREEVIEGLRSMLGGDGRVRLAYVFGSFTRRNSVRDVDVAVYVAPPLTFDEFLDLGVKMEIELRVQVDLVQIQDLDPAFRLKILRDGMPLVENGELRSALIAQSFSELQDYDIGRRKL